jgi:hypothetical protein
MHVIQLRQPWSVFYDQGSRRLEYRRNFHAPSGTDGLPIEIAISLDGKNHWLAATLNETALVPSKVRGCETVYSVNHLLKGFNTLVIEIAHEPGNANRLPEFGKEIIQGVELRIVEHAAN